MIEGGVGVAFSVAIAMNLFIAMNYVGLGLVIARRFDAAAPTWALEIFKAGGLAFFIGCAYTYIHMAYHIAEGTVPPSFWLSWHYLAHIVLQAVGGLAAFLMSLTFINVRLFDRRFTREMIDRMVDEATDQAARSARLRGVSGVVADARRAREAADLILKAMKDDEVKA